ncbi:MAG: UDP-N-acetylmuramoyl-L-alanyl-D-glutamate--2,6-diaminopimelate ligase [Hydrogenovibrio sp.]|uniref:UDP-N-acetylmuramoyl-L-alanyl-D-glutamate--2, 6-diaminopimelate ligase n=1 Tax=Hydrogenovibrio sp. TaxID=2065821 RepID=UPI00287069B0|nr:UDP-N-acetylmuramoyl-L-alanyl-D-glutamate--2,6-diaminopimelate ligase [Hydrogenovibrio sp.]MDR9499275.1 UDP-N-acetylmuramoyl-L-alanyl-D-glutamate--2,6-diaminopimelate ligase [Hydrogenovibrio sp.]
MRALSQLLAFLQVPDAQVALYSAEMTRPGEKTQGWHPDWDRTVTGLRARADRVPENGGFVALPGERHHGAEFSDQALAAGTRLVITDATGQPHFDQAWSKWASAGPRHAVVLITLSEPLNAGRQSELANWFYHQPSHSIKLLGVTGTNGKTSVAQFAAQLLSAHGDKVGLIGTLGMGFWQSGHWQGEASLNTTPEAFELNATLADWRDRNLRTAVMEVSSHAIELGRIAGLHFHALALTQVTQDHLDFHGSLGAYQAAKKRLFTDWPAEYWVLNLDDALGRTLQQQAGTQDKAPEVIGYGHAPCPEATITLQSARACSTGWEMALALGTDHWSTTLGLMGAFQLDNVMCALGLVRTLTHELSEDDLTSLSAVPGRMQKLAPPEGLTGPVVLVDYAHTADGLQAALTGARAHLPQTGQLWAVFGCGGNRDVGKRAQMGQVAAQNADQIVITDDNPRRESPQVITDAIMQGVCAVLGDEAEQNATVIHDRQAAIDFAVAQAQTTDVIVVAGKGHETTQETGWEKHSFYDPEAVTIAYQKRREQQTKQRSQQRRRGNDCVDT